MSVPYAIHLDLIGEMALTLRVMGEGRMQITAFDRRDGFTSTVPLSTKALAKLVSKAPKLLSAVDLLAALAQDDDAGRECG